MADLSFLQPHQRLALLMLEEMLDRYPPPETETAIEMAQRAVSFVLGKPVIGETQHPFNVADEPQRAKPTSDADSAGCGNLSRSEGGLIDPPDERDEGEGSGVIPQQSSEQSECQPQPADEIGQDKPAEANLSQSEPEEDAPGAFVRKDAEAMPPATSMSEAGLDRLDVAAAPSRALETIPVDRGQRLQQPVFSYPDAVAKLYPSERAVLVAARQFSDETFCAADIFNITSQNKGTITAGLTKLVNVGLLYRPSFGRFSFVKDGVQPPEPPAKPTGCKVNPFEAVAAKPVPVSEPVAAKPTEEKNRSAADPLADVVKWLRGQDIDISIDRGAYKINGRIRHTPDSLVEMANRMRSKQGLSLFTLEEAAAIQHFGPFATLNFPHLGGVE